MSSLSRRDFLAALGLSSGGLLLSGNRSWADGPAQTMSPNAFVHLAVDGVVSIVCHRSEMGQGVRSTLPALIADELGARVDAVRIVQGDGDKKYGDQNTDGSSSIRERYEDLRIAGAAAREMLVTVASRRWRVRPETCTTFDGFVVHPSTKRRAAFGELVAAATKLAVPTSPKLRPRSEHKHIGTRNFTLVDGPDIVNGKAIFGADVSLPGLLTAVVLRPPVVGGVLKTFDGRAALKVAGVIRLIELPVFKAPAGFQPLGGIAVVAQNTWAAIKGRAALIASWDLGENQSFASEDYRAAQLKTVRAPCKVIRTRGNTDEALASATRRVQAEYSMPHLAHAPMEPPVATAWFKSAEGTCEIWTSTQNPQAARSEAAKLIGLPEEKVTLHVTLLGGAFGRKSKPDYVSEAAFVSRQVGAPVRLQWTREDDIRHDYFHTTSTQRFEAALDANNKIVAWKHRSTFPPIASTFVAGATHGDEGEVGQGLMDFPLAIDNVQVENGESAARVRIGWMRSVNNIHAAFGINSFIDELAEARALDPKDNLLEILGAPRSVTLRELGVEKLSHYGNTLEEYPLDVGRMRNVIERVCLAAKWSERTHDSERGYGLAFHRSFHCCTAVVVAVKKDAGGKVKVDEVWLCADAGLVVNLERAHSQMEGAVLFGMSFALYSQITFREGVAQQQNFDGYRLARIGDAPRSIHVDIVQSEARPGGIGEPGVPPVAPAIVSAVKALTGRRIRQTPLALSGLV